MGGQGGDGSEGRGAVASAIASAGASTGAGAGAAVPVNIQGLFQGITKM